MAELKTKPTNASVIEFLNAIPDERKRRDAFAVLELMKEATGSEPVLWGDSIVGFGDTHYQYESGREGDWFVTGFSPRKQNLTLYLTCGFGRMKELLGQLGKYKTGKACLYINKLSDVDPAILKELVAAAVRQQDK